MPAIPEIQSDRTAGGKYKELDTIRTASGLKGVISLRTSTGVITFAIVREFTQQGSIGSTSFVPDHLITEYQELVENIRTRIVELRLEGLAPKPRPIPGGIK